MLFYHISIRKVLLYDCLSNFFEKYLFTISVPIPEVKLCLNKWQCKHEDRCELFLEVLQLQSMPSLEGIRLTNSILSFHDLILWKRKLFSLQSQEPCHLALPDEPIPRSVVLG